MNRAHDGSHSETGSPPRTVLGWCLTAVGIETDERRDELIAHAIGGRFRTWAEPSRADVHSVAERLAEQVLRVGT